MRVSGDVGRGCRGRVRRWSGCWSVFRLRLDRLLLELGGRPGPGA